MYYRFTPVQQLQIVFTTSKFTTLVRKRMLCQQLLCNLGFMVNFQQLQNYTEPEECFPTTAPTAPPTTALPTTAATPTTTKNTVKPSTKGNNLHD